jgi:hypothetical protein
MNHVLRSFRIPLMVASLLAAPAALAQQGTPAQAAPVQSAPGQGQPMEVSDREVERFVDAHLQIVEIQQEYVPKIEEAGNAEQAQQLQNQANEEIIQAVRETGLEVQRYVAIAAAADQDEALRSRVLGRLNDKAE